MPEIRKYVGTAAIAVSLALGTGSSTAEEPLHSLDLIVEDTANNTVPGCDTTTIVDEESVDEKPILHGGFSVSHGRADSETASSSPDREIYNALIGRMNSKNNLLTGLVVVNDRNNGVTSEEHFMEIQDRVPFAGAVAILKADGKSGGIYAAATINLDAYMSNIPEKPIVMNPRMKEGYQLSIYREQIDGLTGDHSLDIAGPEAIFQTGSLLISRMIFDRESSEITALAYDKSCQDTDNCQDKAYIVRYRVNVENDHYSLDEILRQEIIAKEDPYDKVEAERVGALVQIGYNSYAYTNGLSEIIILNVTDNNNVSQRSTSVNLEREIRSLSIDPQTGFLFIVCDNVVYTARFDSDRVEIIDSVVNPSSDPSEETGGTAEAIFGGGIAMVPTSSGENDVRKLAVDANGKIVSNSEFAVCADRENANIMALMKRLGRQNIFNKPTPSNTPTIVFSATPSETATSTSTPSPTRRPTATERLNEPTPTQKKPTDTVPSTATNTPKPYSKNVYIPILVQQRQQGRR